jgi:hypothetical protein
MTRAIFFGIVAAFLPAIGNAKMGPIRTDGLIRSADMIAIVKVAEIEDIPKDPSKHYMVELSNPRKYHASVVKCVLGPCKGLTAFFDSSSPDVKKGEQYLVFLNKSFVGVHRKQSYREITGDTVDWTEPGDTTKTFVPLDKAIARIEKTRTSMPSNSANQH